MKNHIDMEEGSSSQILIKNIIEKGISPNSGYEEMSKFIDDVSREIAIRVADDVSVEIADSNDDWNYVNTSDESVFNLIGKKIEKLSDDLLGETSFPYHGYFSKSEKPYKHIIIKGQLATVAFNTELSEIFLFEESVYRYITEKIRQSLDNSFESNEIKEEDLVEIKNDPEKFLKKSLIINNGDLMILLTKILSEALHTLRNNPDSKEEVLSRVITPIMQTKIRYHDDDEGFPLGMTHSELMVEMGRLNIESYVDGIACCAITNIIKGSALKYAIDIINEIQSYIINENHCDDNHIESYCFTPLSMIGLNE